MLFVRTYHGMLGGHLKVFEYMHHVRASGLFDPVLYLTPDSTQSPREWLPQDTPIFERPIDADAYFVGGFNWRILDGAGVDVSRKLVVNLLQGLRHGAAGDPRQAYLSRPALRICVSPAVYESVRESGLCNGPIAMIRNGILPPVFEKLWFLELLGQGREYALEDFILGFRGQAVIQFWGRGVLHLFKELHVRFEQGSSTCHCQSL